MALKVLFVDDEVDLCEIFKESYSSKDVMVLAFNDPLSALDYCNKNQVDLIFLDFRMPKINGDELASKLSVRAPIYLITGESNLNPKFKFKGVISKPFDFAKIKAIIEDHQT
jgi:DNA-binding response OmpR family regulator